MKSHQNADRLETVAVPPNPALIAGIDIGGTTTKVLLCTPDLRILAQREAPTPATHGGDAIVAAALQLLDQLAHKVAGQIMTVGIGAAGVVRPGSGRIEVASSSFTGWSGYPVTVAIEKALGVPAFLDNDVNAFLRGEIIAGALAGAHDALGITLGTGVGGALWVGGELFVGPHGSAGEVGHIPGFGDLRCTCGGRGHLETVASGRAIETRYAKRTGDQVPAKEIARRAAHGHRVAADVFREAGLAVGLAVLVVAGTVDIATVVIGGGVSAAWNLLKPAIDDALMQDPPVNGQHITVLPSALGTNAAALGAAARAAGEIALGPDEGGRRIRQKGAVLRRASVR